MGLIQLPEFLEPRDDKRRKHKGIVMENSDPKKIGRIKVFVKGYIEGSVANLPWCIPEYPIVNGGSPGMLNFSVPEIGAAVSVIFQGGNPYVPMYVGAWVSENMHVDQLFGEDYPNTTGVVHPSGSFSRTNNALNYSEFFHSSGSLIRMNGRGDIELVAPNNLLMRVDGETFVNNNYWQSGGGGMGNVLEELMYAMLEGPYLQGLLDMISLLPDGVSLTDFATDLTNLTSFARSLPTANPDLSDVSILMSLLNNRPRIIQAFQAFSMVEGIGNFMFTYFGLFGVWSSTWLNGSEDLLNATVLSLESPASMVSVLLGDQDDLERILGYPVSRAVTPLQLQQVQMAQSQLTAEIMDKIIAGFTTLETVGTVLTYCDSLRIALSGMSLESPRLVIASLPSTLNTFILDMINTLFNELMDAVVNIDPKSQVVFLDRFGLSDYFSMAGSSVSMISGVIREMLTAGIDRFELGMNGHLVGRYIIQDQVGRADSISQLQALATSLGWDPTLVNTLVQNLISDLRERLDMVGVEVDPGMTPTYLCSISELAVSLVGYELHKERIMQFIDELRLDYPVAEYSEVNGGTGLLETKIRYVGPLSVKTFMISVYELRNNSTVTREEGSGDDDAFDMGMASGPPRGLVIPGSMLSYMGGAIGDLCRASAFASEAEKFLGEELAAKLEERPAYGGTSINDDRNTTDNSLVQILAEVYKWFIPATIPGLSKRINENVLATEMSNFIVGLDPHGLLREVVPYRIVEWFVREIVQVARPRASFAYGANMHQIIATGMIDLVLPEIRERLADIETYVYRRTTDPPQPPFYEPSESLAEGPYYPKTYWYSLLFGCPMNSSQPGYDSMYRRARKLEIASKRMIRLGKNFRSTNYQYAVDSIASGSSVTPADVLALR